jgi:hypothetical protein
MVKDIDYSHKKKHQIHWRRRNKEQDFFLKKKGEKGFITRVNHKYK